MKKILTATAALALALGMTACGSSSSNTATEKEPSNAAAAPTTEAAQGSDSKAAESADTLTLTATNVGKGTASWGIGGSMSTAEFEGEWTQTIELTKEFDFVTFSVTGDFMADNNDVKCTITNSKGEVVDEASGSGKSAMASCTFTD